MRSRKGSASVPLPDALILVLGLAGLLLAGTVLFVVRGKQPNFIVHAGGVRIARSLATPTRNTPGLGVTDDRCADVRLFSFVEFSDYVLRRLPPPPLRVLEVGCGDLGGVTPALLAAGYDVVAIDPRAPEGSNYRRITLEELEPQPFDAVVAGRVLHHVTPLAPALAKLADLAPLLVADEFAWNRIDSTAQEWYERLYQERCDTGKKPTGPEDLDEWRWRHADLHSSETINSELAVVYETVEVEWRPYLYHWLGQETEPVERAAIDAGELPAIGYRLTCQTRTAGPDVLSPGS